MSLPQTLIFIFHNSIFTTQFRSPLIFQTMIIVRSIYERFTLSGFKDVGIRKFEYVAKTKFLLKCFKYINVYELFGNNALSI